MRICEYSDDTSVFIGIHVQLGIYSQARQVFRGRGIVCQSWDCQQVEVSDMYSRVGDAGQYYPTCPGLRPAHFLITTRSQPIRTTGNGVPGATARPPAERPYLRRERGCAPAGRPGCAAVPRRRLATVPCPSAWVSQSLLHHAPVVVGVMIVRCVAGVIEVQVFSSHVDDDFFYIHVDDFSSHLAEGIFLHILYIYIYYYRNVQIF